MMGLESHTFHRMSSPHGIDNQLLCKRHRGCLASLDGRHRCPCVFLACTLLCSHKWSEDKGPRIRWICMSCHKDSPRLFGIVLKGGKKVKDISSCFPNPQVAKNTPTLKAFLMWISSPILWASAHRNVIGSSADGILATRVTFTGVSAVVLYASLVIGTLVIMLTFPSFYFGKRRKM